MINFQGSSAMGSEQMIKFWWRSRSRIQIWIRV